jgi:hypothetical protein
MSSRNKMPRRGALALGLGGLLAPAALMNGTSAQAMALGHGRAVGNMVAQASGGSDVHLASFGAGHIDPSLTLPSARRTRHVSNSNQLAEAMRTAEPGDHIVLANGNYSGPGAFSRAGTSTAPIVVRAANLLGARITGGAIRLAADYQILYGLDFVNTRHAIEGGAVAGRFWRCRFRDRPAPSTDIALGINSSRHADIAHCEFVNWAGRGIAARVNGGARNFIIRRCLFRDAPNQRSSSGAQKNVTEALTIGFGLDDAPVNAGGRIEYNRFVAWSSDDEVISNKSSGNIYFRNSFESCNGNLTNRMGRNNRYEANEFRNTRGAWDLDGRNLWLGNKHTGSSYAEWRDWWVMAGSVRSGAYNNPDDRNASEDSTFAGNDLVGALRVGHNVSWTPRNTQPVRNTRVRQHKGTVTPVSGWNSNTDNQPNANETSHSWAQPSWLTNNDVGPNARILANPPSAEAGASPPSEASPPPEPTPELTTPPADTQPPSNTVTQPSLGTDFSTFFERNQTTSSSPLFSSPSPSSGGSGSLFSSQPTAPTRDSLFQRRSLFSLE